MNFRYLAVLRALCVISISAQISRMELLTPTARHLARNGAASSAAGPEISRDGNRIFFLSAAPNLTTNAAPGKWLNLYVVDRHTHEAKLVSVGIDGKPANDNISTFDISADGSRVMFETAATNMVANDTNRASDVFVRDLVTQSTFRAGIRSDSSESATPTSNATINGDGTMVTFTSFDRLTANDTNAATDVFVRNVATATTELVSVTTNGFSRPATDFVLQPVISDDGRYVVFYGPTNLLGGQSSFDLCLWVRDLQSQTTKQIAPDITGFFGTPVISRDGSTIACTVVSNQTSYLLRFKTETGITENLGPVQLRLSIEPPHVSKDGTVIAYFSSDPALAIWREGVGGEKFAVPTSEGFVQWSQRDNLQITPDGRSVLFTATMFNNNGDTESGLFIYDVASKEATRIATPTGADHSDIPKDAVISDDGSIIAFTAPAQGIQENSDAPTLNVYVLDRQANSLEIVSQARAGGLENSEPGGAKLPARHALSDDSRFMVYASLSIASDVSDTNRGWDIFVVDRKTGHKQLVSVSNDGLSTGNSSSISPVISGNGQWVAFISSATNLVSNFVPSRQPQLFVRDLQARMTYWISEANGAPTIYPPYLTSIAFSSDGSRMVFASDDGHLAPNSSFATAVYLRDNITGSISNLVPGSTTTNGTVFGAYTDISGNGRYVSFSATRGPFVMDLDTGMVTRMPVTTGTTPAVTAGFNQSSTIAFVQARGVNGWAYNLTNQNLTAIAPTQMEFAASDDARWTAIARKPTGSIRWMYLRDNLSGTETLLTTNIYPASAGSDFAYKPAISPDGRFVVFESRSDSYVIDDSNGATDLFLYDRDRNRLDLISKSIAGGSANRASLRPIIAADGSHVVFMSFASDLVPHDFNEAPDIFAAYFPFSDSDADGVDDSWEMGEFGALDHDGTMDTDLDGSTDAQEYRAGTDAKSADSVLRLATVRVTDGKLQINWSAVPGRAYRIQGRTRLDTGAWEDLTETVIASQLDESLSLSLPAAPQTYVRVVLAE